MKKSLKPELVTEMLPEHYALLEEYRLDNERRLRDLTNRPGAGDTISKLYKLHKEAEPEILECEGPIDAFDKYLTVTGNVRTPEVVSQAAYDFLQAYLGGMLDINWINYYRFFANVIHVPYSDTEIEILDALYDLTDKVCLWHPFKGYAFWCKKPLVIGIEDNQFSNETGPALQYADGYTAWMIEGHEVPSHVVTDPQSQTIDEIVDEANSDIRAIRIRRYGWENFIRKTNGRLLDQRHNDIQNTEEALFATTIKDRECRVLMVTCPTGRMFSVPCSEEVNTCEEASVWLDPGWTTHDGKQVIGNTLART